MDCIILCSISYLMFYSIIDTVNKKAMTDIPWQLQCYDL